MTPNSVGGIILCGGKSRRLGRPKELLVLSSKPVLQELVNRLLTAVVCPVVIVGRRGLELPPLSSVEVVRDEFAELGPLEGIRRGLSALNNRTALGFVVAVDMPDFDPALIHHLAHLIGSFDACVPQIGGRIHPLSALYRTNLTASIERQLKLRELAVKGWLKSIDVRWVDENELTGINSNAWTNINTPDDLLEYGKRHEIDVDQGN